MRMDFLTVFAHALLSIASMPVDNPPAGKDNPPAGRDVKNCICGSDCKCKPGECPAKCPVSKETKDAKDDKDTVVVTVEEAGPGQEKISWQSTNKAGQKVKNTATAPAGVKVTEKWAADVVKAVACADGRCPLVLKVRLERK